MSRKFPHTFPRESVLLDPGECPLYHLQKWVTKHDPRLVQIPRFLEIYSIPALLKLLQSKMCVLNSLKLILITHTCIYATDVDMTPGDNRCEGEFSTGCRNLDGICTYKATWVVRGERVDFTVSARVSQSQWVGIGFSNDRLMVSPVQGVSVAHITNLTVVHAGISINSVLSTSIYTSITIDFAG